MWIKVKVTCKERREMDRGESVDDVIVRSCGVGEMCD